jgi:antitoxin CptB
VPCDGSPPPVQGLAITVFPFYTRAMHADAELKRLAWRSHHRGTREADMLIGGFFDAHHRAWGADERALFAEMLDEQDVDIIAWAHRVAEPPERFAGPMIAALRRLDYIRVVK